MDKATPSRIDEISQTDWENTPASVKQLVMNLLGRIEQLERQYEELRAENQLLKEQVQQTSKNSSKPPSQDLHKRSKGKGKAGSGKKRGGQPGHRGTERKLYPIEQCQTVENHYPKVCIECGAPLRGHDPEPYRIQQVEIPKVEPQVSEHRFHALRCDCCGCESRAWEEEIINGSGYGERVVAPVGILSGQYRQSHRMVQSLLGDMFGIELSVGSINRLRQESSQSVAEAVEDAHRYVQAQDNVNMDETSFAQGNGDGNNPTQSKGWLWVMVTPLVSYFAVCLGRTQAVCQQVLGETFGGIVNSDRFSGYSWLSVEERQLCWAHLKRDFTRIAERSGVSSELGQALLEQQRLLFEQWYRVRDGTLAHQDLATVVAPIQQQIHRLLQEGADYEIGKDA